MTGAAALDRFVPDLLRRAWDDTTVAPDAPRAIAYDGALLFADIKGFTTLVEELAGAGRAGIEGLRHTLDTFFGDLIARITAHGGDVVMFAGDALLAYFTGTQPLEELTAVAARCGLDLVEHASSQPGAAQLSLRIAIGTGRAHLATVGTGSRWEFVLVGEPVQQIAPGLAATERGEVALSFEAWLLVSRSFVAESRGELGAMVVRAVRKATPLRPLVATRVANGPLLDAFVAPLVRLWLPTGSARFIGERRELTIVFIQLPAVDTTQPAWLDELQRHVSRCQERIERHEGTVNQIAADDKGICILAVWGLPPGATERSAEGAVGASLEIDAAFAAVGQTVSIGIATGTGYSGLVGSAVRSAFTILGTPVNLAARLMGRASGRTLMDTRTRDAVERAFVCESRGTVQLKGIAGPVTVATPIERRTSRLRESGEVLGRESEIARITDAVGALVRESRRTVLVIEGEAGVGKSALLEKLAAECELAGVRVFTAEAQAVQRNAPYRAVRGFVRDLLGLGASGPAADIQARIELAIGGDAALRERVPLLDAVLDVGLAETDLTRGLSDQARADNLHALVVKLVERAAAVQPVAIVFDDAQWFDSASWSVVRALIRSSLALLVAIATRPMSEPVPATYLAARNDRRAVRIDLGGVSPDVLATLVRRRLGVETVPDVVMQFVQERSEGNPFYCQELLLALQESGQVRVDGQALRVTGERGQIERTGIASTLGGLVTGRVDRLGADEQVFLKVASVLGRTFDIRTVLDVFPGERPDPDALIASLRVREIIGPIETSAGTDAAGTANEWEFRHVIASDAIYEGMMLSQRRELHAAVTRWLEAQSTDRSARASLLAHHATRAELWPEAIVYLEIAALAALERWANDESVGQITEALAIAERTGLAIPTLQRARWMALLAEAEFRRGMMEAVLSRGEAALRLYGLPMPESPLPQFGSIATLGLARVAGRRPSDVTAELPAEARRDVFALQERLTDAYGFQVRVVPMMVSVLRELAGAEATGRNGDAARCWLMLYFLFAYTPFRTRARSWVEHARRLLETEPDPAVQATGWQRIGCAHWYEAEWSAAEECMRRSIVLCRRIAALRTQFEATVNLAHIMFARGLYGEAERMLGAVWEITAITGDRQAEVCANLGIADVVARRGDLTRAAKLVGVSVPWVETSTVGFIVVWCRGVQAAVALRTGDRAAAERYAALVLERVRAEAVPTIWTYPGLIDTCETYVTLAESAPRNATLHEGATASVKALAAYAKTFPLARPAVSYWQGRVAQLAGDRIAARRHFERAEAEALAGDARMVLAETQLALADFATGDQAEELRARARDAIVALLATPEMSFVSSGGRNLRNVTA